VKKNPDRAALLFLKLAEAGHEVAQMNVAHLLESTQSSFLLPGSISAEHEIPEEARGHNRIIAQRFYEMSAEQGSASSELRLGDYAYYGWGISATYGDQSESSQDDTDDSMLARFSTNEPDLEIQKQAVDFEASLARYRKTAEMTVSGEWMQSFVARGSFNLGFMHQFGLGVAQDLHMAKRHYHRCREVDPSGVHTPVTMVLMLLGAHMFFLQVPPSDQLLDRLFADVRVHVLILHVVAVVVLAVLRRQFSAPAALARPAPTQPSQPSQFSGASASGESGARTTDQLVLH